MRQTRFFNGSMTRSYKSVAHAFGSLAMALAVSATSLAADLPLFSWEAGLEDWSAANVTLTADSTLGVTDGLQSLHLNGLTSGFKNDVGYAQFNYLDAVPFDAMNRAAAAIAGGATDVTLEFDLAIDSSNVTTDGYAQLGMFVNSTGVGFKQYGTGNFLGGNAASTFPYVYNQALIDGATIVSTGANQYHVAVPLGPSYSLNIGVGSFFQIGFKSNGVWAGSMDLGIDNMFVSSSSFPYYEEETLFSWETPDDVGTPGVNEQLEGWGPSPLVNPATQALSITSTGATHGSSALQLDRTLLPDGFTWGSSFVLDSDLNPDPEIEDIDPTIQANIDSFVSKINGGARLAVDITYEDQYPIEPTFSQIWLAFTDGSAYYQAGSSSFDINNAVPGTTETLYFEISDFDDSTPGSSLNLATDGLATDTSFFAIALGTSTDDGAIYQLDNFRLFTVLPDSADFDEDDDVDGFDFLAWQGGFGTFGTGTLATGDANHDDDVDTTDFGFWESQFGPPAGPLGASVAVPEPSTALLGLVGLGLLLLRRQLS